MLHKVTCEPEMARGSGEGADVTIEIEFHGDGRSTYGKGTGVMSEKGLMICG